MKLNLISRKSESPDVESFIFEPEEALSWKAGQYLHYVLHHEPTDDRGSDRWFTIASAPFEKNVVITTRFTREKGSSFKSALHALGIGESIEVSYREGNFVIEDILQEYVFIAGGIGITPFHSILKEADHSKIKLNVTLLYGNRDGNIVYKDELDAFAKNNPNLSIHYLISPERINEQAIKNFVPDIQKPIFYVSGPEPMVKSLCVMLEGIGIPKERIHLDDFPGYPAE